MLHVNNGLIHFGNYSILIIDRKDTFTASSPTIKVDLLIVRNYPKKGENELLKQVSCKQFVYLTEEREKHNQIWSDLCKRMGITFNILNNSNGFHLLSES